MNPGLNIVIVEPIGGSGGLTIYDLGLKNGLTRAGNSVSLFTNSETPKNAATGEVYFPFNGVYDKKKSSAVRLLLFLLGLTKTVNISRKIKPDLVIGHFFTFSFVELLQAIAFSAIPGKKLIVVHDAQSLGSRSLISLRSVVLAWFRLCNYSIGTHSEYSQSLIQRYWRSSKVVKLPHSDVDEIFSLEAERYSLDVRKEMLHLKPSRRYFLYFGQIKKNKGVELLVRAFDLFADVNKDFELLIVGRVWQNDEFNLVELLATCRNKNRIQIREQYISDAEVPFYFMAADVVVLPYEEVYSSGVLLRALGYGCAIIHSDLPAFTEFVPENVTVTFESGSEQSLASALTKVASDKSLIRVLAANASQFSSQHLSWGVVGAKFSQLITKLVKV